MVKVSLIIPVFNREQTIKYCLDSIVNQDYNNIEVVIIDDGSTDKTKSIVKKYTDKYSNFFLYTINNSGASYARNYGVKKSTGEYIGFIDSDDYIAKDYVSLLLKSIEHTQADMAQYYGFYRTKKYKLPQSKQKIKFSYKLVNQRWLFDDFFRINGNPDNHTLWNKLYKRNIITQIKLIENKMNEDVKGVYDIISLVEKCVIVKEKKYYYVQNPKGLTQRKFTEKDLDLLYMWDLIVKHTKNKLQDYYIYSVYNRKRANFTLLNKMLFFGYDHNDKNILKVKEELKVNLKKDFRMLLKWKMPISRKVLLIYIYLFF